MFPESKEVPKKKKRDSEMISKLHTKRKAIEARIRGLLEKGDETQGELTELHMELKNKLRLRSLLLKKANGGLLPEEEVELQALGEG